MYAVAVGLSILGSLGGLLTASIFLLLGDGLRVKLVPWLISYAVGTLLGVALLALLPEALAGLESRKAMPTLLAGILAFFLLEKLVLWRHCHDAHECEVHTSSAASLVIVGDAFHTFVDGAVIAAAVVTSIPLGITTALAVATHEIPQEVGDVAILLRAGYSRLRAFTLNLLSGLGDQGSAPRAPVRPGVCGRELSLRCYGRPDTRPASRRPRRRAAAPTPADRGRSRHNRHALKSLEP
jgi:zinc and cadmium transporter